MKSAGADRKMVFILLLIAAIQCNLKAQQDTMQRRNIPDKPLVYRSDTLPMMLIPQVNVYDANKYNYLKSRRYRRQIYNVKKAYPYAVIARHRLNALDRRLADIPSKKEQKAILKEEEKAIMNEFEDELKKLTITQGIILVKLIDREVGQTSYEVVKEIRGGFTAFFWQGIARIFGNDLKMQYDPLGEDRVTEDIIMAIEQGFI